MNIEETINELEAKLFLAKQIRYKEKDSKLELKGFTAVAESTPAIQITGLTRLAKLAGLTVGTGSVSVEGDKPYLAYVDLYDHQFYDLISRDEYIELGGK